MPEAGKLECFLDFVNELYDYARIKAGCQVERLWNYLSREVHKLYRKRMEVSLDAEAERKKPEFEAKLPPDRSLSFFDEYEIINGCPVFTLDAIGTRSHPEPSVLDSRVRRVWSSDVEEPPLLPRLFTRPNRLLSFKLDRLKITCYTFSHDDRYVVCGMTDGSLTVWDAACGSVTKMLKGPHEFRVADVAFLENNSSSLVSVDLDGHCVKWNLNTHPVRYTKTHCAPSWDDSTYIGKELAVPRLSSDGHYLGFPVYTYVEADNTHELASPLQSPSDQTHIPKLYSILFIFETDTPNNDLTKRVDPMMVLPVQIQEPWVGAERLVDLILFSRTSRCLLLTVYELAQGYLCLWPRLDRGNVSSYHLHGTRGRFSAGDRFLVTWHTMLSSEEQFSDSNCYVWDLDNLGQTLISEERSGWNHPCYKAPEPTTLGDPNKGSIHCCDFVRLRGYLGLVTCCVTDVLYVNVWCLRQQNPIHVLKTDILRTDISPSAIRMMSDNVKQVDRVPGTACISVSKNGQWVGVYGSARRCGIVWNASEGVEVLRIQIPEATVDHNSGMDFCFSRRATKLLFAGKGVMLLWCPSVLRGFNPADKPLYVLDGCDSDIHIGQSICRFSRDSNTVGVMRSNSECMTIWRLSPQQTHTLNRRGVTEEIASGTNRHQAASYFQVAAAKNRFCQFAISHDGLKVATCMGDMSVLLWTVEDVSFCRRIATLSSYYCPALDVCFSISLNGHPMAVVCQDQGILVWIDLLSETIMYREMTGSTRSCQFSADGKTAVLLTTMYHVKVWDLVGRFQLRILDYRIPITHTPGSGFYPQLSPNADFCLIGFTKQGCPVTATEETQMRNIGESIWYPETFILSADGQWALMSGTVDETENTLFLEEGRLPDFTLDEVHVPQRAYLPDIDFCEDYGSVRTSDVFMSRESKKRQTWKIVPVHGDFSPKEMRLPYNLKTSKFVALAPDGSKCAALNAHNQLVVWGTFFTHKNIIQQRRSLTDMKEAPSRELIYEKLNEYGPSLTNHPYDRGMTLVAECVARRKFQMLQHLITWSLESGIKLSFQGRITSFSQSTEPEEITPNVIDLAVDIRSPEIIEVQFALMTGNVIPCCRSCFKH